MPGGSGRTRDACRVRLFGTAIAVLLCLVVWGGCTKEEHAKLIEPPAPPGTSVHSSDISQDEVWRPRDNPHLVTRPIRVERTWSGSSDSAAATLRIQPGCIVRFCPGAALISSVSGGRARGRISALGTADSMIVLTADSASSTPGSWSGLACTAVGKAAVGGAGPRFEPGDEPLQLAHCRIERAGTADGAAVDVGRGGGLSMTDCTVRGGAGVGIRVGGEAVCTLFRGNTITEGGSYPIEWDPTASLPLEDCQLSGNSAGRDAILLDTRREWTGDVTLPLRNVHYAVREGGRLVVQGESEGSSARLTVEPGVWLLFERDAGLVVGDRFDGTLVADGGERSIVLTSSRAAPAAGDWRGVFFGRHTIGEETRMVRCEVRAAGGAGQGAGIVVENTKPRIDQCRIEDSAGSGIRLLGNYVPDADTLRARNSFARNAGWDVVSEPDLIGTIHDTDVAGVEETWDPSGNPHRVRGILHVRPGPSGAPGSLRVLPGCDVRFAQGAGLHAVAAGTGRADLDLRGTAGEPIRLVADEQAPQTGFWSGITGEGSACAVRLERCLVDSAGDGGVPSVQANGCVFRMSDCTVRAGAGPGVDLSGFTEEFRGNRITRNGGVAVIYFPYAQRVALGDNALTGNGYGHDRIRVDFDRDWLDAPIGDLTLPNLGVPYQVAARTKAGSGASLGSVATARTSTAPGPRLTLAPGTTILFDPGASLDIGDGGYHALIADGTSELIQIGDSYWGDGQSWNGIRFRPSTGPDVVSRLTRCRIAKGGADGYGSILIAGSRPQITQCRIEHSAAWGIYVTRGSHGYVDSLRAYNWFSRNHEGSVRDPNPPQGPTLHVHDIDLDEVWLPSGNPHIVTRPIAVGDYDGPDSPPGGDPRLEIRPGCVVRFARGAALSSAKGSYWNGHIVAKGTADSLIIFTADVDSAGPGYWDGIMLGSPFDEISWCRVEWAGRADGVAVAVSELGARLEHCTIRGSAGGGASFIWSLSLSSVSITECLGYALHWRPQWVQAFEDVFLSGNAPGRDAILLLYPYANMTLNDLGYPYVLAEGTHLLVQDGTVNQHPRLTIGPGVHLLFERDASIRVGERGSGALVADGTEREIVFASANPAPAPGDWGGIRFGRTTVDTETKLLNCRVADAGGGTMQAGLEIEDAAPRVEGCRFEGNRGHGISLVGRSVGSADEYRRVNTFDGNTAGDVTWDPGPPGEIHDSDIAGTTDVWAPSGNPHHVHLPITVRADPSNHRPGRLRILPGCVIRFSPGAKLTVSGEYDPASIDAVGTADSSIVFTGASDPPTPGSWIGLAAQGFGGALNLSHCRIEAAGDLDAAAVSSVGTALTGSTGGLRMTACLVQGNAGPGVVLESITHAFHDNTITGNGGDAVQLRLDGIHDSLGPNVLTGNATDHDIVRLRFDPEPSWPPLADLTLPDFGVPYVVGAPAESKAPIEGASRRTSGRSSGVSNPTLTLAPGTTLLFERKCWLPIGWPYSYVTLVADGTEETIVLDGREGVPGSWAGIEFGPAADQSERSLLSHCRIANGGGSLGVGGNISITGARPVIRDCEIQGSSGWGIDLESAPYPDPDSLEANNRFEGNRKGNVSRP